MKKILILITILVSISFGDSFMNTDGLRFYTEVDEIDSLSAVVEFEYDSLKETLYSVDFTKMSGFCFDVNTNNYREYEISMKIWSELSLSGYIEANILVSKNPIVGEPKHSTMCVDWSMFDTSFDSHDSIYNNIENHLKHVKKIEFTIKSLDKYGRDVKIVNIDNFKSNEIVSYNTEIEKPIMGISTNVNYETVDMSNVVVMNINGKMVGKGNFNEMKLTSGHYVVRGKNFVKNVIVK